MSVEITIPSVGESVSEVELGEWLKNEGDSVSTDEIVVMLESDKATVELPAPRSGVLGKILKKQGEIAAIGEVIAILEEGAGAANGAAKPAEKAEAKPWKRLEEEQLFIVRHADDETLSFVGAIGGAGEQAGLIVYRGTNAYFGLLDFLERASQMPPVPQMGAGLTDPDEIMAMMADLLSGANFDPMELMQLPQLQLMFEPKANLEEIDEEWIARHAYKASGSGFPTFRSLASGYLPWWIAADEADTLIIAMEQMLELLARKDFSPELLEIVPQDDDESLELFARVASKGEDGAVTWSDERLVISPDDDPLMIEISSDSEFIARINTLPASDETVEVALAEMPAPVGDAQTRPYFPSVLLMGCNDKLEAAQPLPCGAGDARHAIVIDALTQLLAQRANRPAKLQFSLPDLEILGALGQELNIEVEEVDELATLDPAIESLMEQMGGMEDMMMDDFDDEDFDDEDESEAGEGVPKFLL